MPALGLTRNRDFRLVGEPEPDQQPAASALLGPDGKPLESTANNDGKTLRPKTTGLTGKQTAFLIAFVEEGTLSHAAEASGITRQAHYDWLRDPVYRRAFDVAKEAHADHLEKEALRRAIDGVKEPDLTEEQTEALLKRAIENHHAKHGLPMGDEAFAATRAQVEARLDTEQKAIEGTAEVGIDPDGSSSPPK
jgi:hypothetical protein